MKKIYFRNSKNWNKAFAVLYTANDENTKTIELNKCDVDGDFILEFDNEKYDHVRFEGSLGEKSSVIYPGEISIGVEYKTNLGMNRDMTYLFSKNSTKTGRVDTYVINDIKNLSHRDDKSKKINVFVPSTYDGATPHGILYFFDAQNLFCEAGYYTKCGDPYGSWQLDTVLSEIHRQYGKNIIVVGIDNADKYRDHELFMDPSCFGELAPLASALPDEDYSSGQLDNLLDFIKDTLHPFIKSEYSVNDEIGIGGSSMGGIAAFYCGLRERDMFKYILSYSSAFGLYQMKAFEKWFSKMDFASTNEALPKIHIYCGGGDMLETMLLPSSREMKSALVKHGYNEDFIFETYDMEKPHNEESWRLILCESFSKLFDLE